MFNLFPLIIVLLFAMACASSSSAFLFGIGKSSSTLRKLANLNYLDSPRRSGVGFAEIMVPSSCDVLTESTERANRRWKGPWSCAGLSGVSRRLGTAEVRSTWLRSPGVGGDRFTLGFPSVRFHRRLGSCRSRKQNFTFQQDSSENGAGGERTTVGGLNELVLSKESSAGPWEARVLELRVQDAMKHRCCIAGGSSVLIGVSGGVDSTALLELMVRIKDAWSPALRIHVVHFDHGLRPESKAEALGVQRQAEGHGLPFHLRRLDAAAAQRFAEDSAGMQAYARDWRRSEMATIAASISGEGAGGAAGEVVLATGHHADDQLETVLLKMLRGVHLSNIRGMPWIDHSHPPLARPLLEVEKGELQRYLSSLGVPWFEDASNLVPKYKRNKVRLQLVPLLEELAGGRGALRQRARELTQQSSSLREWLEEAAGELGEGLRLRDGKGEEALSLAVLRSEPREMVRLHVLHGYISRFVGGGGVAYGQLLNIAEKIEEGGGAGRGRWRVKLGEGWEAVRVGEAMYVRHGGGGSESQRNARGRSSNRRSGGGAAGAGRRAEVADVTFQIEGPWEVRAVREGAGARREVRGEAAGSEACAVLYNIAPGSLLRVRVRRDGDRFTPQGRGKEVKLKDHLRAMKLPLHQRDSIPLAILAAEDRESIACAFVGAADGVATTDPKAAASGTNGAHEAGPKKGGEAGVTGGRGGQARRSAQAGTPQVAAPFARRADGGQYAPLRVSLRLERGGSPAE